MRFPRALATKRRPTTSAWFPTARIVAGNWWLRSPWDHEITATRAYKFILKSIAQITGHRGTGACILVTSLSLEELDRKSSEFCPNDRAALVAAGILKEKEQQSGPGCMNVARRSLPALVVTRVGCWTIGGLRFANLPTQPYLIVIASKRSPNERHPGLKSRHICAHAGDKTRPSACRWIYTSGCDKSSAKTFPCRLTFR